MKVKLTWGSPIYRLVQSEKWQSSPLAGYIPTPKHDDALYGLMKFAAGAVAIVIKPCLIMIVMIWLGTVINGFSFSHPAWIPLLTLLQYGIFGIFGYYLIRHFTCLTSPYYPAAIESLFFTSLNLPDSPAVRFLLHEDLDVAKIRQILGNPQEIQAFVRFLEFPQDEKEKLRLFDTLDFNHKEIYLGSDDAHN